MRGFWLHQLVEYMVGIGLIYIGLQEARPVVLLVAGGLIALNAALVDGPFGAFKTVSRPVHKWLDVAVVVVLLALAVQPVLAVDMMHRVTIAGCAVGMGLLWRITDFGSPRQQRAPASARTAENIGRVAGKNLGAAWVAGKRTWRKRQQRLDDPSGGSGPDV